MDSNFWYRGTKAVDFRGIAGIAGTGSRNGFLPAQRARAMSGVVLTIQRGVQRGPSGNLQPEARWDAGESMFTPGTPN
jgi:hypothetical protein